MDEVRDEMEKAGITEFDMPENVLHLTKVWMRNDEEGYGDICYNVEEGHEVTTSDDVVLATILDALRSRSTE